MKTPPILVLPHRHIKSGGETFEPTDAAQAIEARHPTDAHAVGYLLPGHGPCGRMRLGHAAPLIEAGTEPVLAWVFCDIDNEGHERWTPEEAAAHWQNFQGPAETDGAGFYSTRGGYRLLWYLAEPIPVSLAQSYLKQFFSYLRAEGVPVDPEVVEQWNTLYRLPKVHRDGEDLRAFVDLSGLEPLTWVAPLPLERKITPQGVTLEGTTRPALRTLGDFEWAPIEALTGALQGKQQALRAGEPYAAGGARQSTMFKLSAAIVAGLELDDPEVAYQAMARSTEALKGEGAPGLDALWDRCCYLVGRDLAKRQARAEVAERVETGQPPIVFHGASYYVRDTKGDTYRPPVTSPAICQALEQWCAVPGLETRTDKGNRPLSTAEYLAKYGRQAVDVVYELGRKTGTFFPSTASGTLLIGCCVAVEVKAKQHPDVGYWLEQLGGEHVGKLLDWLASVRRLDRPTCALYMEGPPSTGKGMFSAAVASLWGTGGTSYADAVGKFNGALTRSPVVVVDEVFSVFDGGEGFSGAFRSLVGESTRQLRRKNMPSATLRGCTRLIIGANNADALKLNEALTKDDLEAIAERVLHIKHSADAAAWLQMLGGREHTQEWVFTKDGTPGIIAEHIAWLEATRAVTVGDRFLVEGELSDWHRDLVGSSGWMGATLAALAHFLHRRQASPGIQIDGDAVWVNVPTLRGLWGVLTGNTPPTEGQLAKALKTLSGGVDGRRRTDTGRLRFYKVSAPDIERRAIMLQIGDADELRDIFNQTPEENHGNTDVIDA